MTVNIISVGGLKEDYYKKAAAEYEKRLSGYCKLNTVEITPAKLPQNPSQPEINAALAKESELITAKFSANSANSAKTYKIALCIDGERLTSEGLSRKMAEIGNNYSGITFIIGGSHGLSDNIKQSANLRLSMSDMTFPHRLARIMLLEQLYRVFSIQNNLKYHK